MLSKSSLLALLLAILHAVSGLTLLLVSSWFIAACAVAGLSFNYMLPAVIIRALALIRIASGYAEMWVSHHQLLGNLAKIRLSLFNQMQGGVSISRANDTDKLNYQSQDVASIWTGWINQNAGALLSLLFISIFVLWQLVAFSSQWFLFLISALVIYTWLILSGLSLAYKKQTIRTDLESQIEHHFNAANIWHMQKELQHPNAAKFYNNIQTSQQKIEWAITGLLTVSIIASSLLVLKIDELSIHSPILMLLPMALLASADWFGRTFFSHHRLHDYVIGKQSINSKSKDKKFERLESKINAIGLTQFKPSSDRQQNCLGQISEAKTVTQSYTVGQLHLVSGSSGAGKSRLFQAIVGLIPHDGRIFVDLDKATGLDKSTEVQNQLLDDVLYIEQTPYCLSGTVRQNLLVAQTEDSPITDEKITDVLNMLGLASLSNLDQWIGSGGRQLSGGETKRLGLARAVLSSKSFLLLDEPFEGLDEANINKVVTVIKHLTQTRCVVIASHIYPEGLEFDSKVDLDS